MLLELLREHRATILRRTRDLFLARSVLKPTQEELQAGIPIFLEQLDELLATLEGGRAAVEADIANVAARHGERLFALGFTASQLVGGYGAVCEVVTDLAAQVNATIPPREFETLNRALDVAIAESVTAYQQKLEERLARGEAERLGALAHELRNTLTAAALALGVIRQGTVGPRGRTSGVLERSIARMRDLVDRALAEVRLKKDFEPVVERVRIAEMLDDLCASADWDARRAGVRLDVDVERGTDVEGDRQLLVSILSNLVSNAIAYTPAGGRISVRSRRAVDHVLVDVEDECGGLPPGKAEELFRPFVRGGHGPAGLGLGLAVVRRAATALGAEVRVRDMPGKGCVFTVEIPVRWTVRVEHPDGEDAEEPGVTPPSEPRPPQAPRT